MQGDVGVVGKIDTRAFRLTCRPQARRQGSSPQCSAKSSESGRLVRKVFLFEMVLMMRLATSGIALELGLASERHPDWTRKPGRNMNPLMHVCTARARCEFALLWIEKSTPTPRKSGGWLISAVTSLGWVNTVVALRLAVVSIVSIFLSKSGTRD